MSRLVLAMTSRQLGSRVLSHFWLKAIGSTIVISLFFVAYFTVLNHPIFPVREMPVVLVDHWVPVLPFSVWIYFTLWIYICLPSSLMDTRRLLGHYLLGAFVMSLIALSVFALYPTAVPAWPVDWSQHPTMAFLKTSDAAGNACPSLHVGFAVFAACWMRFMLNRLGFGPVWRWANWVWCLAIVLSTLTTKQHVFLDVVFGSMLGAVVAVLNIRYSEHEALADLSTCQS